MDTPTSAHHTQQHTTASVGKRALATSGLQQPLLHVDQVATASGYGKVYTPGNAQKCHSCNAEPDSRESRALKCIKDCLVDEGDHANIIQDDDWKQLTGDMFDDIQKDNSNEMVQENDENDAVKEVN